MSTLYQELFLRGLKLTEAENGWSYTFATPFAVTVCVVRVLVILFVTNGAYFGLFISDGDLLVLQAQLNQKA